MERKEIDALLRGYRVLDLTDEKGLLCGRILADMGAEVIKVEKPGGDDARRIGPFYKDQVNLEKSLFWFMLCMNKKSITLDIHRQEGQEILKKLAEKADFLVESSSPGYLDRLGLGYKDLNKINKQLVYVSITPFGQSGPYANFKGPDIVVWALSGFLYLCGNRERPPVRFTYPQAYFMACGEAAIGALLALNYREVSGEGQQVDTSAQHTCIWPAFDAFLMWENDQKEQERAGGYRWKVLPKGLLRTRIVYQCKDGYVPCYVWGGRVGEGSNKALDEWIKEEGFDTSRLKKAGWPLLDMGTVTPEEYEEIVETIAEFIKRHTKDELYEGALRRGVMLAPVSTIKDICQNKQLKEREFWVDIQHDELGDTIRYPGRWALLSETPFSSWNRAPLIGEHNKDIYMNELKMSSPEIEYLSKLGVI